MPKCKTKKSASKRFQRTSGGKITYAKAGAGHLMGAKTRKRKRTLRAKAVLSKTSAKRVSRMIAR